MFRSCTAAVALLAAVPAHAQSDAGQGDYVVQSERNTDFEPAFDAQLRAPASASDFEVQVQQLAGPLVHPWGIAQLPDGGFLVTERPGRMRHVSADGTMSEPLAGVPEVHAVEQGGLLDVALGRDFADDRTIYFTYSKPMGDGSSATAAARAVLSEDNTELTQVEDIFVQEPASPTPMHYGSRVVVGDEYIYITTGEHFTETERGYAQDLDKTYGKVVRLSHDGSVPEDNPFVGQEGAIDSIWTLGHRNVQAATLDASGQLWTVEHGPKGGDELNRDEAGLNFGWPVVSYGVNYDGSPVGSGEATHDGDFTEPVYFWDPVIAPSGMAIYDGEMFPEWDGDMLIGSLYPGALVRVELEDGRVTGEERLVREQGRIRDVEVLDDGSLALLIDAESGAVLHVTRAQQS